MSPFCNLFGTIIFFNLLLLLGATISSPTATVYSMDEHVINCVLKDIPNQITGVKWNPATQISNSYTLEDGTHGGSTQTSTLTISSYQLGILSLKNSGSTHTFTCEITVGTSDTPVRATQTIAVYTPSKCRTFLKIILLYSPSRWSGLHHTHLFYGVAYSSIPLV